MNGRSWRICAVLMFFSLISLYWGKKYFLGFLLGEVISILIYKRNESYWNGVVDMREAHAGTGFFHFIINYALMAGPMILAAIRPQWLNIFTVALGMTLIKIAVTIEAVIPWKENDNDNTV